jgi:hypothetical protein
VTTVTVLADGATGGLATVDADVADGRVIVDATALPAALGWTLKAEGLCRDDVCVPVWDRSTVETGDGRVDLVGVAAALDRPALVDEPTRVLAVGAPRADRRAALSGRRVPDVELPDLGGNPQRLEQFFDRRVTLVAFASW